MAACSWPGIILGWWSLAGSCILPNFVVRSVGTRQLQRCFWVGKLVVVIGVIYCCLQFECFVYSLNVLFTVWKCFGTVFILETVGFRALCRIKVLPVRHVLVDTWMLTVNLVYKLLDVPDDMKWATNTHDTIYTHFQGITNSIYGFGRFFCSFIFYLSIHVSARPYSFLPILITGGWVFT